MSKHVREKCGKLCISSILSSKRGITPTKIDANWRHLNLICSTVKQSHMQNFSSICQSVRKKCGKQCIFSILSSKRGITPTKIDGNWRHSNLICSTVKQSHIQKLDMSKHVGEKCGKLHITYILSSQRGITPSKIGGNWRHSNLICSTLKQSHVQNFSSICQSMYEKSAENGRTETRTESRTDGWRVGRTGGHHHTIIRPVWRRAYKNEIWIQMYLFLNSDVTLWCVKW